MVRGRDCIVELLGGKAREWYGGDGADSTVGKRHMGGADVTSSLPIRFAEFQACCARVVSRYDPGAMSTIDRKCTGSTELARVLMVLRADRTRAYTATKRAAAPTGTESEAT